MRACTSHQKLIIWFFRILGNVQASQITNEDLKRLNSINRKIKLKNCYLNCSANIQITELFKFVDKHMALTGTLRLHFADIDENLKADFIRECRARKKIIPTCFLRFYDFVF